ncbi:unnamed protein product [Cylindrotheca closterium]|uniref:Uncharacterized protein n=1 Tax=Cylindrotheca closterium TaxID=2856 RepID=A0AAD2FGH3_9STRA|nr:unnamed protein product [Cylindrotheca closterium]
MIPRAFLLLLLVSATVLADTHHGLIRKRQLSDALEERRHTHRGLALKYHNKEQEEHLANMIHRNLQHHQAKMEGGRNLKHHHKHHPTEAEIEAESKEEMEAEAIESAKEEEIKEEAIVMADEDDEDDDDDDDDEADDEDDDDDDEADDDDDDDEDADDEDDDDDDDDEDSEEEAAAPAIATVEEAPIEPETEQVIVSEAAVEDESPIAAIFDGADLNESYWVGGIVGFGLVVLLVGMARRRGQKRSRPSNVETLNLHHNLRDPEIEMVLHSGTGLSSKVLGGGSKRNSTPSFGNNKEDEPIWSIRHSMTSATGPEAKAAVKTARPSKKNSPPASAFKQHKSKF